MEFIWAIGVIASVWSYYDSKKSEIGTPWVWAITGICSFGLAVVFYCFSKKWKNDYISYVLDIFNQGNFNGKMDLLKQKASSLKIFSSWQEKYNEEALDNYFSNLLDNNLMLSPTNFGKLNSAAQFLFGKNFIDVFPNENSVIILHMVRSKWFLNNENKLLKFSYPLNGILLDNDEHLLHSMPALLKKNRTRTQKVAYSGVTGSFKIAKGIRYRVGEIGVSPERITSLEGEDFGNIYITNKKLIFKGPKNIVSIDLDKIVSFEITDAGLTIGRKGAQTLTYISLGSYDYVENMLPILMSNHSLEII